MASVDVEREIMEIFSQEQNYSPQSTGKTTTALAVIDGHDYPALREKMKIKLNDYRIVVADSMKIIGTITIIR